MGQQVTLTISAEDTASGVITKVAEGLDRLTKQSEKAGSANQRLGDQSKQGGKGIQDLGSSVDTLANQFRNLFNPTALLGTFIGVQLVGNLRSAIAETINYASELRRLHLVTDASYDDLTSLSVGAHDLGVDTSSLQRAFFLMTNEITTAGTGLGRLGISIRDSQGNLKGEVALLLEVSDKLHAMGDATKAANIARDIFDRGAAALIPLLRAGSERIKELGKDAKAFGIDLQESQVNALFEYKIAVGNVADAWLGLKTRIVQDALPAMQAIAEVSRDVVIWFRQLPDPIRKGIEIFTLLAVAIIGVAGVAKLLTGVFSLIIGSPLFAWIASTATALFTLTLPISATTALLVGLGAAIAVAFAFNLDSSIDYVSSVIMSLKQKFQEARTLFSLRGMVEPPQQFGPPDSLQQFGPPESAKKDIMFLSGELQKQLQLVEKLTAAQLSFAKATQTSSDAQIAASKAQEIAQLRQLAISIQNGQLRFQDPTQVEKAKAQIAAIINDLMGQQITFEQLLTASRKAFAAERAKIASDEVIQRLVLLNQVVQAEISATMAGSDAAKAKHDVAVKLAQQIYSAGQKTRDDELRRITAIKTADFAYLSERLKLEEAHRDAVISLSVQETATNLSGLKQQEEASNTVFKDLIALRQHDLDNFKITQEQFTAIAMAANDAQLQNKRTVMSQELADNEQNRITQIANIELFMKDEQQKTDTIKKINADAFARIISLGGDALKAEQENNRTRIQLERDASKLHDSLVIESTGRDIAHRANALEKERELALGNANLIRVIDANLFKDRKTLYDREVQQAIDAALKETDIYRNKAQQLIAIEAGRIAQIEAYRQNIVANTATVLTEQARLAGNLDAVFAVGFAHAASSADDAFTAIRRSGADAYQSLKSGLSDYLFAVTTGAGKITDIFINLGKRILRSMTDAFAEILVKQIAMSAGFSFAGLFGIVGTARAGTEGVSNQTAQALVGLGNAATGSTESLNSMTGVLGFAVQAILFFANGLMGILSFFGQIIQGIASGGGIFNTITTVFGSLIKAGGMLSGVFSGLSSIATVISSTFQGMGSLAAVFQSVFQAVQLTSGGFAAGPAVAGGTPGLVGGPGVYAQFAADWLPVIGALYSLATTIQSFFNGPLAVSLGRTIGGVAGAAIGSIFGPAGGFIGFSIGSFIGGFFGGLFGPTPKSSLSASFMPFNRNAIGSSTGMSGNTGTQVGRTIVNVGGNIMKNSKEKDLELALAAVLNKLLQDVVTVAVGMLKILPPSIATQLDAALTQLETTGLSIIDKTFRGGKAGKKFSSLVNGLLDDALQDLVKALSFGDIDLKALGFDPKDPKGKNGGEVRRGFETLITAIAGLSAIVKAVGPAVDLAGVSLAAFAKGALDLFKSFAQKGEPLIDTIKRVMQAFSEIIALRDQVHVAIAGLTKDLSEAVSIIKAQMATAEARMIALADALTVAIQSGAKPEDVLATAQAATKAVLDTLKMEIDAVTVLHNAVKDLNSAIASSVDFIISLTQKINTLRGVSVDPPTSVQTNVNIITRLFGEITDVTLRISLFSSQLVLLSESTGGILANMPLVTANFNTIMTQIEQMSDPTEAVAALKGLAGAIDAGLQAGIAGINRQTQARISALNIERDAIVQAFAAQQELRRTALEVERALLMEHFNTQKQALQDQLVLAREWKSISMSARGQLVDLFNLLAPTHPAASLKKVQAQFETAFVQFQAAPTTAGAGRVQDLAKQLLDLAKQTPGYDLPSAAFQGLAANIQAALEAIAAMAEAQPTEEQIQAQIVDLEVRQAASLVNIDAQLAAINAEQSSQLASIDAQIREASLAGQAQIERLQAQAALKLDAIRAQLTIEITALAAQQALAAAALHAVLGDKTFEQFIADKQAKAVDLLRSIDRTLQDYLATIITALFPGAGPIGTPLPGGTTGIETIIPHAQDGMAYVRQDGPVFLHRGERVLSSEDNRAFSGIRSSQNPDRSMDISFQINVYASGEVNVKRLVDDMEGELVERLNMGRLRAAILAVKS